MKIRFHWGILAIFVLAVFLRFVNFPNRWGLGYDQASFAIVGKHAADSFTLPLLGPFSSGGPFQTSGLWYWIIASGNILFPHLVEGPWIFIGFLSIATVAAIIIAGIVLGGKALGLVAGLLTAVSTAQITQSTNLSNQTPIALPASLALIASFAYIHRERPIYLLFLGLGIGTASAIHLQGLGLLPLALVTLVVGKKISLLRFFLLLFGLVLPWLPVFIADSQHDWYNTKNMIRYYTVDQYAISLDVLGRRWKTFLTEFTISLWGLTIGGFWWAGIITLLSGIIGSVQLLAKRMVSKLWITLLVSFLGMLAIVRYTRVPLYESFVVFLHPFILLITAGITITLFRLHRYLGILFLVVLLIPTLIRDFQEIRNATNTTARRARNIRQALINRFPASKFALYDYRFETAATTLPLLLYLDQADRIDPDGYRVGMAMPTEELSSSHPVMYTDETGTTLYDLESSSASDLDRAHWAYLDFPVVYKSVQHWW